MPNDTATIHRLNGADISRYLPGAGEVDGRTVAARAFKAAVADIVSDLGGEVSRAELEIARRCAGLAVLAAQTEAAIVGGEAVDPDAYTKIVNSQTRALSRLGLQRRQRDVSPFDPAKAFGWNDA